MDDGGSVESVPSVFVPATDAVIVHGATKPSAVASARVQAMDHFDGSQCGG